jgi:CheY-like chemotaxis protein
VQKILIVPQNLLQVELGSSFLDRKSLSVRAAATAEAAYAVVARWQPALVVFGSALPGVELQEFCARVRCEAGSSPVRLLMLSSRAWAESHDAAGLPCDAHLLIPARTHDLLRTLAGLLDLRERRATRVPFRVLAQAVGLAQSNTAATVLVNTVTMSEVGLLVEAPEPLGLGSGGEVRFFLSGHPARITVRCAVQYLVDELQLHYALSIVDLGDAERGAIRAFTSSHTET